MSKSSKRAKSLLEQIADIADPRPKDFDIENAGVDDNAFVRAGSESGDEVSDHEELKRDHYIDMGKSTLRRNQGIGQMGPKYVGSRVSRKDLYDGPDDSDEDLTEEIGSISSDNDMDRDGDMGSDAGSDSDEAGSDDDVSVPTSNHNAVLDMEGSDSDSDSGGASEPEAEVKDVANGSRDRIRDEIKRLEEGEKALLKSITQTARSDVEKGQHAVNQMRLWEGALDARIRVQKLVTAANELPQYDLFSELVEGFLGGAGTTDDDNCLESARQSVGLLLGSLVDLRRALVAQSPSVKEAQQEVVGARAGNKRSADQALDDEDELAATWGELEELRGEFQPYRDSSLEKWSNKVQISSSVTATKKFKAVNQGIMHQISQALAGKDRLVERTQLKRAEYKIIGKPEEKQDGDEPSKRSTAAVDTHLKDRDVEIFDDTDFYQQLLRELIESRMVDSNDPTSSLGVRWAAVKQQTRAKKRTMDSKASKGRKIRYHVIEKLQSFMPPIPAGTWHEDMVNELFSSLLGQKVPQSILDDELETFNSDPSKKSASAKSLVQAGNVSVGNQGLRLFG
ncbi:rRNA-processing protein bfr2 [Coemansia sp. RSA 2050]|nr:rRNA-processing protein bfr2 [Coemansia sp. RSA 2050]KAJ2730127.1 rRNA-processing protein bfr2 [Coemansia sp. BCRC 34962]